jgi:hypothetical protein
MKPKARDHLVYKRGPNMGYKGTFIRVEDQIVTISDAIVMVKDIMCKY